MNIQNLVLDINKKPFQTITANTGEIASRFVRISIIDKSTPVDLTGVTVSLYAKKTDGNKVFNNVTIEDKTNGIILAELTSQILAVEGLVELTLLLVKNGGKLCSKQFLLNVDSSIVDDEAIESTNEFTALVDALGRVNNIDSRFEDVNSQLEHIENEILSSKTIHVYPVEGDNRQYVQNIIDDDKYSKIILHGDFNFKTYGNNNTFINIKSNKHIVFDNAKFLIKNTNMPYYRILNLLCVENVIIENPYLIGDNDVNTATGEWGHGVNIQGCKNIQILNAKVFKAFGDGMNIADDENKKCEDIYVNSLYAENCGRQGLTIYGGDNIKVDYVHAKDIRRTAPSACIDIETNNTYSTYGNINIGKVISENCAYGVLFEPMAYANITSSDKISISIEEIYAIKNTDVAFAFNNIYGTNMNGIFSVNVIKAIDILQVLSCKNSNKNFYLYVNNIYAKNVGGGNQTDGAPFIIDSSATDTPSINNIIIDNVNATFNANCNTSLYITNNMGTSKGAERNCSFTFSKICNLPARVNGDFNPVKISGIELSLKDFTQGWATHHFKGNVYSNLGCTSFCSYAPYSFDLIGNETTFEVVEPYSVTVNTRERTIYPSSLNFTGGFQSNEVGSKITFKQQNENIIITEIIGTWTTL